jgi:hypothetical protein
MQVIMQVGWAGGQHAAPHSSHDIQTQRHDVQQLSGWLTTVSGFVCVRAGACLMVRRTGGTSSRPAVEAAYPTLSTTPSGMVPSTAHTSINQSITRFSSKSETPEGSHSQTSFSDS